MDWLIGVLIGLPPVVAAATALLLIEDGKSLKGLIRLLPRRKPKAVQEKAAFEELYRWKKERRLADRTEWNARYTELLSKLPGSTITRKQVGLTTERVTIKAASGEIVTQFEQPIAEYIPGYYEPGKGRLSNAAMLGRIRGR